MSDDFLDPRLAERLTRAARAAQALSETLWEALLGELADPRSERVAELSERLGEVAAVVASLARVDAHAREQPAEPANAEPVKSEARATTYGEPQARGATYGEPEARATTYGEPQARGATYGEPEARGTTYGEPYGSPAAEPARPFVEEPAPPREPAETQRPTSPAVLIDELAATESPPRPPAGDSPREERPQIEIRDERSAEGPAAWIDSIGRRLERYEQDRAPFAVLLVELVDVERLRHAESAEELSRLTSQVEDALARELRPADSLTRERAGRYWLLAPHTDGQGAQVLIERIARAVRSSASHRGTPLEVAVGVAVCPEDGLRASELAAHADVGLYAARAAGRPSVG
jgi:GGDEF domain-containing protein